MLTFEMTISYISCSIVHVNRKDKTDSTMKRGGTVGYSVIKRTYVKAILNPFNFRSPKA